MPSSVIGALRVVLGLDSAQFSAGAASAEKRAEQLGFKIGRSMRGAASSVSEFTQAFTGLSVVLGAAALGSIAAQALEYASSLGEVAQQLGVTTKDLQEYRYAASQVGISQEEMDKGLAKLTVTMGQAREGVDKPKAAFKELSDILGKDVLENAATAGDAIPLIADALARVDDPAKRAAIEVALFGKTGQRLDTLLSGGSAAVNALRDAAEDLGIVISNDDIQNADRAADKLTEFKLAMSANIAGVVAHNAGAIYDFVTSLETLIARLTRAIGVIQQFNSQKLKDFLPAGQTQPLAPGFIQRLQGAGERFIAKQLGFDSKPSTAPSPAAPAAKPRPRPQSRGTGAGTSDADAKAAARAAAASAKRDAAERKRAADKDYRDERRYQQDLGQSRDEALRAQLDITVEQTDRAQIQRELLNNENRDAQERIRTNRDLTEAQKRQLLALNAVVIAHRGELIERQQAEELAKQEVARAQARLDSDQDILAAQASLARTAKERAQIELLIVDKQFEALRLAQQAVLDSQTATAAEKDAARDRLGTIDQLQTLARAKVSRDNQGPLASYLDGLPRSADEMNEAFEHVAADGLGDVIDGLAEAAAGTRSLGDVFKDVANDIIKSLIRIGLQRGAAALFGKLIGGTGEGSLTPSDLLGKGALNGIGGPIKLGYDPVNVNLSGARANGGPVIGGRNYLVGERGIEVFRAPMSGQIVANDDIGTGGGTHVSQTVQFSGAIDLATRSEVYRVAQATHDATLKAVDEKQRRRA